jgi:hypothetical protein
MIRLPSWGARITVRRFALSIIESMPQSAFRPDRVERRRRTAVADDGATAIAPTIAELMRKDLLARDLGRAYLLSWP